MTDNKRPLRVFLCHASGDNPAVRKLHRSLVKDGINAWLDINDLLPGEAWEMEIPKAVRASDVVVVCLSQKSITKEGYLQKEIAFALDVANEKPDGTILIIPAKVEDCEVPRRLAIYMWVNLYSSSGYDYLLKSLRRHAEDLGITNKDYSNLIPYSEALKQTVQSSSGEHIQINNKKDGVYVDLKQVLNEIGKKYFKISVGHPKSIPKGYESSFVIQLYFEELSNSIKVKIKEIIGEDYTERVYDTELKFGQVVKIKLFSPDINFPEAIAKKLSSSVNTVIFLGKPLDTCQPREHKVVLSILDKKTDIEYQSETFSVKVVDYAFDHVSRPLFAKVSASVLGVGSFIMFILALLEQIDKTVGLTSGTATGVLAVVIYTNFYNLYQRIRPNTP